jgi:hypothetical protein
MNPLNTETSMADSKGLSPLSLKISTYWQKVTYPQRKKEQIKSKIFSNMRFLSMEFIHRQYLGYSCYRFIELNLTK